MLYGYYIKAHLNQIFLLEILFEWNNILIEHKLNKKEEKSKNVLKISTTL